MPRAKPRYDVDGSWKEGRRYDEKTWAEMQERLHAKLQQFYPHQESHPDSPFAPPSVGWINSLLHEAYQALSITLWTTQRLPNEEMRAELIDILQTLTKAASQLNSISFDANASLSAGADVLGCRDKLLQIIPYVKDAADAVSNLPRALRPSEAQHRAAIEMAIRVLHILRQHGMAATATADTDAGYVSNAVQILKIIGDELGLVLQEDTWKKVIIEARLHSPGLQ